MTISVTGPFERTPHAVCLCRIMVKIHNSAGIRFRKLVPSKSHIEDRPSIQGYPFLCVVVGQVDNLIFIPFLRDGSLRLDAQRRSRIIGGYGRNMVINFGCANFYHPPMRLKHNLHLLAFHQKNRPSIHMQIIF